jgi:hypothetical protein
MQLLLLVLFLPFLKCAALIYDDVWHQISEYLTLKDLMKTRAANRQLQSYSQFAVNKMIAARFRKPLLQVLLNKNSNQKTLIKLLFIHNIYKCKFMSFDSMRRLTFHHRQERTTFQFLLHFYTDQLLHHRDPKRSHEIYRNEDVLAALVAYYDMLFGPPQVLLSLTNHDSLGSLFNHYSLYSEFWPVQTKRLIRELQELTKERRRQLAEAMILCQIK